MSRDSWLGAVASATLLLAASPALAQPSPATTTTAPLRDQLDEDVTPVPVGMGALMVPSLTDSEQEPNVIVLHDGSRVASGRTGERIILPPGQYEVVVGQGSTALRARKQAEVAEGVTTPVRPFFGAVRVAIVNRRGQAISDEYVIGTSDGTKLYGPIETEGEEAGTSLEPTWLLPPGQYVLALGDDADSDSDVVAISVAEGEVMRYRLVVDEGRLQRSELADEEIVYVPSPWRFRWIVGGNGTLSHRRNTFTGFNGGAVIVDAFTHLEGGLDAGEHLALLTFNARQSFLGVDTDNEADTPLRTLFNEADLEALYNYRISRIVGPYVRGIVRTSFFESHIWPDEDSIIVTNDEDGNQVRIGYREQGERTRTFKGFAPTTVQEGVGLSVTPVDNKHGNIMLRAGAAARQAFYRDGRFVQDVAPGQISMTTLDDREEYGAELTAAAGVRLSRSFSFQTRFDSFASKEQLFEGEDFRPVFRFDNTLAFQMTNFASVIYDFSLHRDHVVLEELQTSQFVALRLQHILF